MSATPMAQDPALTDGLWVSYRANRDPAARAQLLDRHVGLVYHVAREIASRSRQGEMEDLVSAGTLGLVRALDSFDHTRGLAFSTYAVRRIRGAILDDLRSRDWTPRSVRSKARRLAEATARLQSRLGREPEAREIATELDIELETYWEWRSAADGGVWVSFDTWAGPNDRNGPALEDVLTDPDAPMLDGGLLHEDRVRQLRSAIAELPQQERTVLALYYYEELNLRQIADILHVTQSRISQIRTKALSRLKRKLSESEQD
jgi:RNA polymerase sigma factor FliA